jgi:hypothetical protein
MLSRLRVVGTYRRRNATALNLRVFNGFTCMDERLTVSLNGGCRHRLLDSPDAYPDIPVPKS